MRRLLPATLLLAACGPAEPLPVTPPTPVETASAARESSAPSATAAPSAYTGHGLGSISPELLKKYAPTPLPASVTHRIQALLDVRAPSAGILSPDGKSLYFGWSITGVRQVFRIDGAQRFPVQMTGGEDATRLVAVTPDGKWILHSRDRKGEENPGLYAQDAKGGPLVEIQHKPGVRTIFARVSADGRFVYYRANDRKPDSYAVYRFDLKERKSELLFGEDGLWDLADVGPKGQLLLAKDVGSNMSEYYELTAGQRPAPLFGQGEREDYVAAYGASPGEILVRTPRFGEFRRLYAWREGKFTPVTRELKHDVSSFQIDEARERILYTVNEGGYTRLFALEARTHKEVRVPPLPSAAHVWPGATTHDGKLSTVSVDLGAGPPRSFVIDWKTKKAVEWHQPSAPETSAARFARAELSSYPARDGAKIPAFVRRPASCERRCPVLVDFHGGPEGQATAGYDPRAQIFVDAGFIHVAPNVRGSDGYGKAWLHADDGAKRLAVITDLEDAAKWARSAFAEGGQAPKVGVMGWSYGGYSTLVAMTMFAGAYDAGAAGVSISSLITFLQNTAPYRRALRISEYGDPDKDRDALVQLSPITHVDKLAAPLLLVQGANDPRTPVGEAVQFHEVATKKGVASKLIVFADEGHGMSKRENQVLALGAMVQFFQQQLQGQPGEAR